MDRRSFIVGSIVALAAPIATEAQRTEPLRRIAYLGSELPCDAPPAANVGFHAFLEGLHSLGYRDRQNVAIECRSAEGKIERLDALAAELVQLKPAVLVAAAAPASLAAKRATATIPIVSVYTADPVELGLVASLARPGGNVTGISALASDYVAKSLELLKDAAPRTSRVGVLGNAANPTYIIYRRELQAAAPAVGVVLDFGPVNALADLESTLSGLRRRGADGLLVMHQPFTFVHRQHIVEHVAGLRLPTMYGSREAVEAGGLMSYAVSVADVFRRGALIVDNVMRGAKPSDLPIEQPTKFELVINLKTAKVLGLEIPATLLATADEVIE